MTGIRAGEQYRDRHEETGKRDIERRITEQNYSTPLKMRNKRACKSRSLTISMLLRYAQCELLLVAERDVVSPFYLFA